MGKKEDINHLIDSIKQKEKTQHKPYFWPQCLPVVPVRCSQRQHDLGNKQNEGESNYSEERSE